MWCRTVRKLVYDFADGTLSPVKSERVRSHLTGCVRCREAEEDARLVTESLSALPDVPPPEDGFQRLETRLAFLPSLPAAREPAGRLRTFALPYAAGLATAAAILLVVVPLVSTDVPPVVPTPEQPATGPVVDAQTPPPEAAPLPDEEILRYVTPEDLRYLVDGEGNLRELDAATRDEILNDQRLLKMLLEQRSLRGLGNPGEVVPVDFDGMEER